MFPFAMWPVVSPPCVVCARPVENREAHAVEVDGRVVAVHRECCAVCKAAA